jgi:DNA-binding NarL/FixJ family response regulator
MIADGNPHTLHTLRRAVDVPEITIVVEAETRDELVETALANHPDVILLALSFREIAGSSRVRELAEALPSASIVVIGSSDQDDEMIDAMRAGASGFLRGDVGREALLRAIRGTARGDVALSRGDARRLVERVIASDRLNRPAPRGASRLSAREREVVRLLSEGQTAREMAVALGISTRTVEGHVAKIREKLGAKNRADAVRRYLGSSS